MIKCAIFVIEWCCRDRALQTYPCWFCELELSILPPAIAATARDERPICDKDVLSCARAACCAELIDVLDKGLSPGVGGLDGVLKVALAAARSSCSGLRSEGGRWLAAASGRYVSVSVEAIFAVEYGADV